MTSAPLTAQVPALVARTVEIPDPGPLLSTLPSEAPLVWVRRGEGLAGWGEAARFDVKGSARFTEADKWWRNLTRTAVIRDEVQLPGTGPVAFGSFTFDDGPTSSSLVLPETVVGHREGRWWVTTVSVNGDLPPWPSLPSVAPIKRPGPVTFADGSRSGAEWGRIVADAVSRINAGELEKVVLARELIAETPRQLDLRWPLRRLSDRYPRCWTFSVDGVLGATPELLVRRERGLVTSRVLAGTIRRTRDDVHDLALAASLARSSKDLEEHEFAVRSVADALAPFCSSMNIPETPFVLHLPNVMHLATDLAGVTSGQASSLLMAGALHPSAAVGGTPTKKAQEMIRELEALDRGRYAAPVGWIDSSGDGEWGIALRCAQVDSSERTRLRLFAGCGIVAGSDPTAELAESVAKLVPMRDALST
ncbi:isochorismate synthase [Phytoactinopolyspora sp. XMNu-373]|uniref:isochorismate synthase n=1 Tax=Phytoactinopolyspora mesophila TaxID=2650750 RepID=A0A7K3M309_9ACTN|nr:isochorismate synthase [Phytoactinopolyspora mesophila]